MAGPPQFKTYREKRKPKRLRGSHGNTVPAEALAALQRRSRGLCEVRADGCWGRAEHPHHRRLKAQGVDHSLDGLLAVCSPCHAHIHANPAKSYAEGWLIRSNQESA